jgi:hypothetical protein
MTLALNGNDLRMMGEPINERDGTGRIRKHRVPLLEWVSSSSGQSSGVRSDG